MEQIVEYVVVETSSRENRTPIRARRFRAYSKLVQHLAGACAALYELITGEDAPKFTDALRG